MAGKNQYEKFYYVAHLGKTNWHLTADYRLFQYIENISKSICSMYQANCISSICMDYKIIIL